MFPSASEPRDCSRSRSAKRGAGIANTRAHLNVERCALNSLPWTLSELNVFFIMRRAIYPGSFDPVTNGHLDVIERARKLFDEVIVAVAHNDEKQALFSLQERLDLLQETAAKIDSVRITQFDGLLVEFAAAQKATAVIRGLRAVSDFEFEFQMALMNRKLEASVETIFLMPKEEFTYLSSRLVKEIARLGGDVSSFVPPAVAKALGKKFAASKKK
jgi:pantetheine-phosphate adenylyltransferase